MSYLVDREIGALVVSDLRIVRGAAATKGLLGSRGLAEGGGLLLGGVSSIHTCFMKFSIDVVFIDDDMRVKGLRSDVRPWRLRSCSQATATLELPAGTIRRHGMAVGDSLEISDEEVNPGRARIDSGDDEIPIGDQPVVAGRSPDCALVLQDDSVSRTHVEFRRTPAGFVVADLDSRNGTIVNGRPVRCRILEDGDEVEIGAFKMHIRITGRERPAATAVLDGGDGAPTGDETAEERAVRIEATMVRAVEGRRATATLSLAELVAPPAERHRLLIGLLGLVTVAAIGVGVVIRGNAGRSSVGSPGTGGATATPAPEVAPAPSADPLPPPRELVEQAEEIVAVGDKLYRERNVVLGNLHAAIVAYARAQELFETYTLKPRIYYLAHERETKVKAEFERAWRYRKFAYTRALRLGNYREAREEARRVMLLIPDPTDDRHRRAAEILAR